MDEESDRMQPNGTSVAWTQLPGMAEVERLLRQKAVWASPPAELERRVLAGIEVTDSGGSSGGPDVLVTRKREAVTTVAIGAVLGLAWTASLRGWMTQFAGEESTFTWVGTFACLLLPGVVVGGLLGWAEAVRRTGGPRNRWLVAAPLLFGVSPLLIPGAIPHLFATGQGTASLFMVSLAMLAGASLTGRGPTWRRALFGAVGFAIVPAMIVGTGLDSPQDTWEGVLFSSLFVVLALSCAIPQRIEGRRRAH